MTTVAQAESIRTQAQVEASRLNGARGRGPRTELGKARSSLNALKHGLSARVAVIPGEEAEAFDEYRQALYDDLQPAGALEASLVERIAVNHWRLQRAVEMEGDLQSHDRYLAYCEECKRDGRKPLGPLDDWPQPSFTALGRRLKEAMGGPNCEYDTLGRYERRLERGLFQAIRELRALHREMVEGRREGRGVRGDEDAPAALSSREPRHGGQAPASAYAANTPDSPALQDPEQLTQKQDDVLSPVAQIPDRESHAPPDAPEPSRDCGASRQGHQPVVEITSNKILAAAALAALAPDGAGKESPRGDEATSLTGKPIAAPGEA